MKKEIKASPFIYPIPIVLCGVRVNDKPNFTTIGDIAVMGLNPPLIVISLNQKHYSTLGVRQERQFSINLPTAAMLAEVDYCGMVSGRDVNKAALFEWAWDEYLHAVPIIQNCPVNLICEVIQESQIKQRVIFICEVKRSLVEETYIGKALNEWQPISYGLDNQYYALGDVIGQGYHAGKALKK